MKFFAFFDLNKLIKIFTGLLLERRILIVSESLERISSCALSLEALIYPLEWLQAFVPLLPEHIDRFIFYQPFPYIYGVHTSIYKQLNTQQLNDTLILLVDEREILNGDRDELPKNIAQEIRKKLKFFHENNNQSRGQARSKFDNLLKTGPIKAFQDAVLALVADYRSYVLFDEKTKTFKVNDEVFYAIKEKSSSSASTSSSSNNSSSQSQFYREFRMTVQFEEVS